MVVKVTRMVINNDKNIIFYELRNINESDPYKYKTKQQYFEHLLFYFEISMAVGGSQ